MYIRILTNIAGNNIDYRPGDVLNVSTAAGNDLVNALAAIPEGPAPSGLIAAAYQSAGYVPLAPDPSGYIRQTDGVHVADAPSGGGFYCPDSYTFTVVFPGKRETTFDILKLRPPTWR